MVEKKQLNVLDEFTVQLLNREMSQDPAFQLKFLKGQNIDVEGPHGVARLKTGRLIRRQEAKLFDGEFGVFMGEIVSSSGHRFHALIQLCVQDSCEHYGVSVFAATHVTDKGKIAWDVFEQGTPQFDAWVEEMKQNVDGFKLFPYSYRYRDANLRDRDHHVGDDGWSL